MLEKLIHISFLVHVNILLLHVVYRHYIIFHNNQLHRSMRIEIYKKKNHHFFFVELLLRSTKIRIYNIQRFNFKLTPHICPHLLL
jgi:hypothetical protein